MNTQLSKAAVAELMARETAEWDALETWLYDGQETVYCLASYEASRPGMLGGQVELVKVSELRDGEISSEFGWYLGHEITPFQKVVSAYLVRAALQWHTAEWQELPNWEEIKRTHERFLKHMLE